MMACLAWRGLGLPQVGTRHTHRALVVTPCVAQKHLKVFGCFVTHLHITSIIIFAIKPVIHTTHYNFFLLV